MAVSGPEHARFGGEHDVLPTPRSELRSPFGDRRRYWLRHLQRLVVDRKTPQRFTMLLTHFHWDHIQGLPVFAPLFDRANALISGGRRWRRTPIRRRVVQCHLPPLLAGRLGRAGSRYPNPQPRRCHRGGAGARDPRCAQSHPRTASSAIASRITHGCDRHRSRSGRTREADARLLRLAHKADTLIHDAQYTPEEHRGCAQGGVTAIGKPRSASPGIPGRTDSY